MSWNGIQMPQESGVSRGLSSLQEALARMAQDNLQRQQMAAALLRAKKADARQAQLDYQAAYGKAQSLAAAGDMEGAHAIMAPYAPQMGQRPLQATTPSAGSMTGEQSDAMEEGALQGTLNPIAAAQKAEQDKGARSAKILRGTFGGQQWTIDPEATREARGRRFDSATQGLDEETTADYQKLRPALMASNQDVDPADVVRFLHGQVSQRRLEEADRGRAVADQRRLDQQLEIEKMREQSRRELESQQQAGGKYKRRSGGDGGGGDGYNPRIERANKAALSSFDTSVDRWSRTSDLDHLAKSHEEAERAQESLRSGNPAGAAHALEKFVSVSRSGIATNAALGLFQKHLSGVGGTAKGYIERLRTGNLGAQQIKNLNDALETVQQSIKSQIEAKRQAFVNSYFTPAYSEMKGNVEDRYERLFGPLGYKTEYDPNAKTIALGTGRRATATGRGTAAPAALSPDDQSKAQMARERLAKDPNDAVARQWLEHHGLK